MRDRIPLAAAWSALVLAIHALTGLGASGPAVRPIGWQDVAPVAHQLESHGITAAAFASYVERLRQTNARRVREGDLDHLIFYLLQSTHFTTLPAIEPALSARALVENRATDAPPDVKARASALLRAIDSPDPDARLTYFRELSKAAFPRLRAPRSGGQAGSDEREAALLREYLRVMRFLYEKEFVAQRSAERTAAVADLYRTRGLSTDTAVEAGFLVHQGLGVMRAVDPGLRIRRTLIVGPGLDLAPRTSLREAGPPQSYQPWAVMDALLALGLSRAGDLVVVAADINPRVVQHLRRAHDRPPALTLASEIRESDDVSLSVEYREYFAELGRGLGAWGPGGQGARGPGGQGAGQGDLLKTLHVSASAAAALQAETLDIVTERLTGAPFDLIVATNILPYFDDPQLALAMVNIAAMLAPGGTFLHNEGRPSLGDLTSALGLPLEQSRHAVIATVRGAPPLTDSVWLHRKGRGPGGQGAARLRLSPRDNMATSFGEAPRRSAPEYSAREGGRGDARQ